MADGPESVASEGVPIQAKLTASINRQIAASYPDTAITLIAFPSQGGFHWVYENAQGIFNLGTYDAASARVSPGTLADTAALSPAGGFVNSYVRVVTSLAFVLSTTDREVLDLAQQQASMLARRTVATYRRIFGPITDPDLATARHALGALTIASEIDYVIAFVLGYQWSGRQDLGQPALSWRVMQEAPDLSALLPEMPPEGSPVVADVRTYIDALGSSVDLEDRLSFGGWTRRQLIDNTAEPTLANGGIRTVDPVTGRVSASEVPGFAVTTPIATLRRDLDDPNRLLVFKSTSAASLVLEQREGRGVLDVPELGLRFDAPVGTADLGRFETAITSLEIIYPGFSLATLVPDFFDTESDTGWYASEPIVEAVRNTGHDVTGFTFVVPPPYRLGPLAAGGDFGMIQQLLISRPPLVRLSVGAAEAGRVEEIFGKSSVGRFAVLDGAPDPSYALRIQDNGWRANPRLCFDCEHAEQAMGSALELTAFIIGGTFVFPGDAPA